VGTVTGSLVLWFASELRKTKQITLYQSPTVAASLIGTIGVVAADLSPAGEIMVNGEYWTGEIDSEAGKHIAVGTDVEVVSVDGNHLRVRRVE